MLMQNRRIVASTGKQPSTRVLERYNRSSTTKTTRLRYSSVPASTDGHVAGAPYPGALVPSCAKRATGQYLQTFGTRCGNRPRKIQRAGSIATRKVYDS
ncbi:hypothetical protein EAG_08805 [Camponotus floridanus]|uniref:Uncharacterized protein n=1 Tax=Camponotus floridanus TaxID=104421 RepID=E2AYE1_CAMFO|nr:hypothetical protein EAG_08805 [Camponotus floridanus]